MSNLDALQLLLSGVRMWPSRRPLKALVGGPCCELIDVLSLREFDIRRVPRGREILELLFPCRGKLS